MTPWVALPFWSQPRALWHRLMDCLGLERTLETNSNPLP